jgi:hypothetical protein
MDSQSEGVLTCFKNGKTCYWNIIILIKKSHLYPFIQRAIFLALGLYFEIITYDTIQTIKHRLRRYPINCIAKVVYAITIEFQRTISVCKGGLCNTHLPSFSQMNYLIHSAAWYLWTEKMWSTFAQLLHIYLNRRLTRPQADALWTRPRRPASKAIPLSLC